MSSRHLANLVPAAQDSWRRLAEQSGWDVPTAAGLLGLSLRQLERQCQRDFACTPTEWFHRERMTAAARLLNAGKTVKAVATELGYTLPANFSRDFKRHHGRTPRTFVPRLLLPQPGPPPEADPSSEVE